ncbi:MAG TPA: alpha-hydroxy-acid oxidizing enzyme [Acidimicrobiaceae bacterium]|nr:alpha-hydroxy-acid oxidizing enzyme [Acidimicrobiaceae bacterium]HCB36757.1 alpha-hydroxy-acid oxidizing enzyme [Acidimicrobiaceae bacterium]
MERVAAVCRSFRAVARFRRFETDADARRLARVADVGDLRRLAKRRLPAGCFDYIDGAAEDELTAGRNVAAFAQWQFRPRVLRDVSAVDTTATVLGEPTAFPLLIAPTGFGRIARSPGELAVAAAAQRAGVPYSLSTMGTRSIEEVAAVNSGRKIFQVNLLRDRSLVSDQLARARDAGYEAVMLSVDTAVLGRRERDVRHGFTMPPQLGVDTLLQGLLHPAWTLDFLRAAPIELANMAPSATSDPGDAVVLADYIRSQFDPSLSWDDIEWFRQEWPRKIMVKGIQGTADAVLAAQAGVDAVILSNHGGRQLDGAPAPADLIRPVRDALGTSAGAVPELICDGGVRRGSDIVKALALGADSVMVGRACLYALAAAGEAGVDWVLEFLRDGMVRTMALAGVTSCAELTSDLIERVGEAHDAAGR